MRTDPATLVRIAAMSAAETAIENNPRDPFVELEQVSAAAAEALAVNRETVLEMADDIVITTFTNRVLTPKSETAAPGKEPARGRVPTGSATIAD